MNVIWIGMAIGAVMGLTGSGGALVAIPLFMHFLGMNLKEATSFSLVAVSISALFNLLTQWEKVDYRLSYWIVPFAIISSYFMSPLKNMISEWMIFSLLALVSLMGLISVWLPVRGRENQEQKRNHSPVVSAFLGTALGLLTTITGLGGGVFLMPAFILLYRFPLADAVASSFLPILLTSLFAFAFQWNDGSVLPDSDKILMLGGSIALTAIFFPMMLRQFSSRWIQPLRKIAFSLIVLLSISKILGVLLCK